MKKITHREKWVPPLDQPLHYIVPDMFVAINLCKICL